MDGFDQFNRVHIAPAERAGPAGQPYRANADGRANDHAGRRFRRFEQTRARVMQTAPDLWRIENLDHLAPPRPPALDYLVSAIFLSEAERDSRR